MGKSFAGKTVSHSQGTAQSGGCPGPVGGGGLPPPHEDEAVVPLPSSCAGKTLPQLFRRLRS